MSTASIIELSGPAQLLHFPTWRDLLGIRILPYLSRFRTIESRSRIIDETRSAGVAIYWLGKGEPKLVGRVALGAGEGARIDPADPEAPALEFSRTVRVGPTVSLLCAAENCEVSLVVYSVPADEEEHPTFGDTPENGMNANGHTPTTTRDTPLPRFKLNFSSPTVSTKETEKPASMDFTAEADRLSGLHAALFFSEALALCGRASLTASAPAGAIERLFSKASRALLSHEYSASLVGRGFVRRLLEFLENAMVSGEGCPSTPLKLREHEVPRLRLDLLFRFTDLKERSISLVRLSDA